MRFLIMMGLLCFIGAGPDACAEQFAIVSLGKDQKIVIYSIGDGGSLTPTSEVKIAGNPGAMCVDHAGRRLYVALKKPGEIAAYRISDRARLEPLGNVSVGAAPSYLSVHPSGKFLLSCSYAAGKVFVHQIFDDGKLSEHPIQVLATDERAHSIVLDPTGKFVFVPHTRPNAIFQFAIDPMNGKLTLNDPSKLTRDTDSGPRHLWFHPNNGCCYGSDEKGSSVTAYRMAPNGQLQVVETLSSLPVGGFDGRNTTSDIEVHPSGKYVYIANRGHNTIASFSINNDTGRLTLLQHTPTEPVTRSFNISPDGNYLVAAGQTSGKLAVFRIGDDGLIKRVNTIDAGDNPWWVQIVSQHRPKLFLGQGTMAGEVTNTTALLQTRLTKSEELNDSGDLPGANGVACFEWSTHRDFREAKRTSFQKSDIQHDFVVRQKLSQLQPGTLYYYRTVFGLTENQAQPGPTCSFKTLPGVDSTDTVRFIVGSCMNYNKFMHGKLGNAGGPVTATERDKRLGFPAFAAMQNVKPDFFVGTGDIVYYDNPYRRSETVEQLRRCWHEQFRFPRMIDFFKDVPAYWSKDDHDFRYNDSDNASDRLPLPSTGIDMFREQLPIAPMDDRLTPTYRTHRVNQQLQIWLTEGRDFRSPNKMPDGPKKSLWGPEQREWLKRTLKESDAKWKILISPTPMVGPDMAKKSDNHASLDGFRHEADAFFKWVGENNIEHLTTVCGDRHWQYRSIHPSGVEEFACGALNDENSRLGIASGAANGTDPQALVRQPFTSPQPSGGFLVVTAGDALEIEFFDAKGKSLYRVAK